MGDYEGAIASYTHALGFQPNCDYALYNKACCSALMGKIDEAVKLLHQALQINPQEYQKLAQEDPDFDGIRHDERFQSLLQIVLS